MWTLFTPLETRDLGGETPIPTDGPPDLNGPTTLVATPVLGGLPHRHERREREYTTPGWGCSEGLRLS